MEPQTSALVNDAQQFSDVEGPANRGEDHPEEHLQRIISAVSPNYDLNLSVSIGVNMSPCMYIRTNPYRNR